MSIFAVLWAVCVMLIVVMGISIMTLTIVVTYGETKKLIRKYKGE